MLLILATTLSLTQIQFFGWDVPESVVRGFKDFSKEIHQGDCVKGPEVQAMAGVENIDLYYTYVCGVDHLLTSEVHQTLACGLDAISGVWMRQTTEHDKPGVYFPSPVPCMSSVVALNYSHTTFNEISDVQACTSEGLKRRSEHTEILTTQKFGIGQGEAFLPNPLYVKTVEYAVDESGADFVSQCRDAKVIVKYLGWGSFQVEWSKSDCLANQETECFKAKVGISEDDEGNTCGRIKKLVKCSDRLDDSEVSE